MQNSKWLSKEALQIAEKRKEAKRKGEKERYVHLNAKFQRIARRHRKPSSVINANKQRKTIEKTRKTSNLGKTRDLFKKIRDTKGTFHSKMGTIKDRNGMDLTEGEDLKKSDKSTQKNCTKKILITQITMMV